MGEGEREGESGREREGKGEGERKREKEKEKKRGRVSVKLCVLISSHDNETTPLTIKHVNLINKKNTRYNSCFSFFPPFIYL